MQIKKLLKMNAVTVVDGDKAILKVVGTPFDRLTRRWCRHEAQCLSNLAELDFEGVPKFIRASSNSITMEKIEGTSLNCLQSVDQPLFVHVLNVVRELHRLGFAHGNLRLNNIFISDARGPVLIDFETCCRRGNALFFFVKFSDDVRLYLLWQSRVDQVDRDLARKSFPAYVTLAMFIITPLNRFGHVVTSIKKRLRNSFKAASRQRPFK